MYLEELTSYKMKFMKTICNSDKLLELLNISNSTYESGDDIVYKQVFPFGYVPDIQNEKNVFICFDVEIPRVSNKWWKDVALHIFVFAHRDYLRTDKGTRIDLISERIDKLINDSDEFGFGLGLVSVKRFMPTEDYYGVELYYEAVDFNNGSCRNARK